MLIIFHNLKNYDGHHIVEASQRKYTEHTGTNGKPSYDDVKVIAHNAEKFLQIEIGELRFLDSYQFLSASLDELVSLLLKSGKHNIVHTQKHLGTDDDLAFSKGVYPYSYMTGPEKFEETQLPPIESTYDKLKAQGGGLSTCERYVVACRHKNNARVSRPLSFDRRPPLS